MPDTKRGRRGGTIRIGEARLKIHISELTIHSVEKGFPEDRCRPVVFISQREKEEGQHCAGRVDQVTIGKRGRPKDPPRGDVRERQLATVEKRVNFIGFREKYW